jgi:hypothetical protein
MVNTARTWQYVPVLAGMVFLLAACDERPRSPLAPPVSPALVPTYTLSGVVWEDTGAASIPLQGALVTVSTATQAAISDSGGSFRIEGLRAGTTTMSVTRSGYASSSRAIEIAGDTQSDMHISRLSVVTFTLSGIVYEDTAAGRVPVPEVEVYCDSCGSPDGHTFVTTGGDGAYRFGWANNGATPLYVTKAGYRLAGSTGAQIVAPVNGDTRFDIQLVRQ